MLEKNYTEENYQDFKGESPVNVHPKCLWVLVIDTSYSMTPYMDELTKGLQEFKKAVERDPVAGDRIEVSIVEFNSEVKVRCAPKLIEDLNIPDFQAGSATFIVEGVERAIQVVDHRVQWYRDTKQSYYQPFVVLITDGEPNGPGDPEVLGDMIRERMHAPSKRDRFVFVPFGVTDADMDFLAYISDPSFPPLYVKDANFTQLFQWLSASTKAVSRSTPNDQQLPKMIQSSAADEFQREI